MKPAAAATDAVVRQIVLAKAERAFQAFVEPADVGVWMFGPSVRDERILSLASDPRIGGKFSFQVERRGEHLDHTGIYKRFAPGAELAFTWIVNAPPAHGDLVQVTFAPLMAGTEVTLRHQLAPDWVKERAKVEAAWGRMLAALARHLASQTTNDRGSRDDRS